MNAVLNNEKCKTRCLGSNNNILLSHLKLKTRFLYLVCLFHRMKTPVCLSDTVLLVKVQVTVVSMKAKKICLFYQ